MLEYVLVCFSKHMYLATPAATQGKTTSKGFALSRPDPAEAADGLL